VHVSKSIRVEQDLPSTLGQAYRNLRMSNHTDSVKIYTSVCVCVC